MKTLLGDRVKEVRLTHRLTDTPAVVSTDNDQMTTQMAKLFAAAGQPVPEVKYTFEINPEHHLVKKWRILQTKPNSPTGLNYCLNRQCLPNVAR
ncbi:chaperone protein HtpG [Rodentibacter pneumotropicus]|uniref:Chaperone protein HtpG n=1 Tax=Rodentibacter pneumotropicus TaxID=758 RepID=A0A3S4UP03_9PAST|nr:chaperone protein HtpG [Rodentibacter pneumotropicus]